MTKLRVISLSGRRYSSSTRTLALAVALVSATLLAPGVAGQDRQNQDRSNSGQSSSPPAGSSNSQQKPGDPPPSTKELPPNSTTEPLRPESETQQSVQPQSNLEQQRRETQPGTTGTRPPSPEVLPPSQQNGPGGLPSTSTPAGTAQPGSTTPGQDLGNTGIAPTQLPASPPPIEPDYRAPQRPLPSAERVGVDVVDQSPLSLGEAITLALENNNDINALRIDTRIAGFNLRAALGIYDPRLSSESYYERSTNPVSSLLGGGNGKVTQKNAVGTARFGGFAPYLGGSYQLDFSSNRLTTDNSFVALSPQYPTALTFTYTQPLLRGLRIDENRRNIEVAKRNLSLTDAQFRQRVIEVITNVERAYWDLAFALRNLDVQIEAVKQARLQVESNERLVREGILAPIDVVAAQTQVTTFEQNVYSAQEAVTRSENTLKTLMLPDRKSALWTRALLPVTPVSITPPAISLPDAVSAALLNRPEMDQLEASEEINKINTRFLRDQTKPQLDLVGTYSAVGLAGTLTQRGPNAFSAGNVALNDRVNLLSTLLGLPVLPPAAPSTFPDFLIGGYSDSLSNLFRQRFTTTRIGIRLSLPIRNRVAEANLGRSLAEGERLQNRREQFEQSIEADVRNAIQAVRSAEARLAAAAATRTAADMQYESEQRKFQAGMSTVFFVLQRQTDLIAARGRELQAQIDLNKAIAEFNRVVGRTLQVYNVTVQN